MRRCANRWRRRDLINVLLAVLVVGFLCSFPGCGGGGGGDDDVAVTLDVRLQNADGTPVEMPDVGGILIEFTVAKLDMAVTEEKNRINDCRAWVHSLGENKYRLLRLMPATQGGAELVANVHILDSEQAVTGAQIIEICNHANQPLAPGDYKIVIQ